MLLLRVPVPVTWDDYAYGIKIASLREKRVTISKVLDLNFWKFPRMSQIHSSEQCRLVTAYKQIHSMHPVIRVSS